MLVTVANKITFCRILAVPFFIITVLYYTPQKEYLRFIALGIFLCAAVSDAIDGYIARTRHQMTKLGAVLDPLADKLLLMSAFICLSRVDDYLGFQFPSWLVITVISRDIMLFLGILIIRLFRSEFDIEATRWGKMATIFQVASILGLIMQWPLSYVLWYPTFILTAASGAVYVYRGTKVLTSRTV